MNEIKKLKYNEPRQFNVTRSLGNKRCAPCLSKNPNNFVISYSIALKLCHFRRNLSRNITSVNMSIYCLLVLRDFTFIEHYFFDKTAFFNKTEL